MSDQFETLDFDAAVMLDRLKRHRTLGSAPREELEWLIEHGEYRTYAAGTFVARKSEGRLEGMFIVLKGRASIMIDRGSGPRKAHEWNEGDVMGLLPYSRLKAPPGDSMIEIASEALLIREADLPAMIHVCQCVTTIVVHEMLDRARQFKSGDLQYEKMVSLGKLAAGLAHELNNPASSVARGAKQMLHELAAADDAALELDEVGLTDAQRIHLFTTGKQCSQIQPARMRSSIEQADREDELARWLSANGADESIADVLAESEITIEMLDGLGSEIDRTALSAGIRWIAAGCAVRKLAAEIAQGANRISELVSAVKGFTYMDQAKTPLPTDVAEGIRNAVMVLNSKARSKSIAVNVEAADDVPHIKGLGGELNQVWANLIDNAIDAVGSGGHVDISVHCEGPMVIVRIADDGPGIPEEIRALIFDPFFTTKPIGHGTGMGLEIARRIINEHRGDIQVTSAPGRTTFAVALPIDATTMIEDAE